MTDALLSADGRQATSIQTLARLCGCHRDQIRVWRRDESAPADLDLRTWHTWLTDNRKWSFAGTLAKSIPEDATDLDPSPPTGDEPASGGTAASTSEDSEAGYRLRLTRARALAAERTLAELDGRLVDRSLLVRFAGGLSAVVVARLNRGIWDDLISALDAATPDTRRAVREAHDRAIVAMRCDLGDAAVRRVLADVLSKPKE